MAKPFGCRHHRSYDDPDLAPRHGSVRRAGRVESQAFADVQLSQLPYLAGSQGNPGLGSEASRSLGQLPTPNERFSKNETGRGAEAKVRVGVYQFSSEKLQCLG